MIINQALDIIGIINIGVIGMQFNEAIGCGNSRSLFLIFIMRVGRFKLGLLCIATVRISSFQSFKQFN